MKNLNQSDRIEYLLRVNNLRRNKSMFTFVLAFLVILFLLMFILIELNFMAYGEDSEEVEILKETINKVEIIIYVGLFITFVVEIYQSVRYMKEWKKLKKWKKDKEAEKLMGEWK